MRWRWRNFTAGQRHRQRGSHAVEIRSLLVFSCPRLYIHTYTWLNLYSISTCAKFDLCCSFRDVTTGEIRSVGLHYQIHCHEITFPYGTRPFFTAFSRNNFFSRALCHISHYPSSYKVSAWCLPAQSQNLRPSVTANSTYLQLHFPTTITIVDTFSFTCNPNINTL